MDHELAAHALAHKTPKKATPKPMKEFHAKEVHDGTFHITKHSGKPGEEPKEGSATDMDQVHDALEEHMGQPNEGEAAADAQGNMEGREMGGPVEPGKSYMVGEGGPETFQPRVPGIINPDRFDGHPAPKIGEI